MSLARLLVVAVLLLGLGSVGAAGANAQLGGDVSFGLRPQNNSAERGVVTLTPMGNQTRVSIRLRGEPSGAAQPAHIHEGSCATLNPAPKFPLNNVVNGRSDTVVNATVQQIMAMPHAVNVHRSPQEVSVYVACGELSAANQIGPGGGAPAGAVGPSAPQGPSAPAAPQPQPRAPQPMGPPQQMPRPMGQLPMTMPRTGDAPVGFLAALGLGVLGAGLVLRRRAR